MRLKSIAKGVKHHVLAVLKGHIENEKCPVNNFFDGLGANFQRDKEKLEALIDDIADHGTQDVPQKKFHLAKKGSGIYRVSEGRLRIYCFFDAAKKLIICSHGCIKQTKSTREKDLKDALKIKSKFEKSQPEDIEIKEE